MNAVGTRVHTLIKLFEHKKLPEELDRRFLCGWFSVNSYVSNKEGLISEIERYNPDFVVMGLDLYGRIDGIETSRQIRSWFGMPIIYF